MDLRLAIRTLRSTPVVTVVAVLSLALGIGANTAIFTILDSLLLRALPVQRPDRLGLLMADMPGPGGPTPWSNPVWEQIRDRRHDLFQTAFAFSNRTIRFNLSSGGQTVLADGVWVSGDYFSALGVPPLLGRVLTPEDDRRGGGPNGPVAVISYGFWQRQFGGAPDVIGRTQNIERVPFTIVGVMPKVFFGAEVGSTFDLALPLGTEPVVRGRDSYLERPTTSWLTIMVRLKELQTLASVRRSVPALQQQIREATMPTDAPADLKARYLVNPMDLRSAVTGASALRVRYQRPLLAVLTVVLLVLLIACANVANLLLARAAARRHEFSLRMAIGASRWRLARQAIIESSVLAATGALIGVVVAYWGSGLLVRQLSTHTNTVYLDVSLNWRVLGFTAALTSVSALLFGIVPALRASRAEAIEALREGGRGLIGERRIGLAGALVAAQVALSLVLVVVAGLFLKTFASLTTRDLGFDRDAVLLAQLDLFATTVGSTERVALYEQLADAARHVPGASHAAISAITPVSGSLIDVVVQAEGGSDPVLPRDVSYRNVITPDWFMTYGTRLVAGRDFESRDSLAAPLVAIVNETFARKFLAGPSPIGRRIRTGLVGRQGPWIEVVGLCADATYRSVRDPVPPTIYVPLAQQKEPPPTMSLSIRAASGTPALLSRSVAERVGTVNPNVAITFTPLKQQVEATLVQERILAMLAGFFGTLALLLAGLGLYGIAWYAVSRRRNEIGVRAALGATPGGVIRLVMGHVSLLVGAGVLVGLGLSWWAMQLVAPLLYDVTPRDRLTLVWSAAVLTVVGALAGWLPAVRASRIDPAIVLRST